MPINAKLRQSKRRLPIRTSELSTFSMLFLERYYYEISHGQGLTKSRCWLVSTLLVALSVVMSAKKKSLSEKRNDRSQISEKKFLSSGAHIKQREMR